MLGIESYRDVGSFLQERAAILARMRQARKETFFRPTKVGLGLSNCCTERCEYCFASADPLMYLLSNGLGNEIYNIARETYPQFEGLLSVLAEPIEVMADVLEDRDKALRIMDIAAKRIIDGAYKDKI